MVGDFNVWVDDENNKDGKMLQTLMSAYGLSQLIRGPTHRNGHTLDQVYTNEEQVTLQYEVHKGTYGITTDHYPCFIEIPNEREEEVVEMREVRPLGKIDIDKFREDMHW